MSTDQVYVGIDVAQDTFDVAVYNSSERWTAHNDTRGIADPVARLEALTPTLVVMEATGGLEHGLARMLTDVLIAVDVVNPARIRSYAKAVGRLAKTDRIDTEVIAHFAQAIKPEARPQASADAQEWKDLLALLSEANPPSVLPVQANAPSWSDSTVLVPHRGGACQAERFDALREAKTYDGPIVSEPLAVKSGFFPRFRAKALLAAATISLTAKP